MAKITALFWDVGGVLLSNAWDHEQRQDTLKQFDLDDAGYLEVSTAWATALDADPSLMRAISAGLAKR